MTNAEIAARIKRVMEDPEGVQPQELEELASAYASRCREVDEGFGRAYASLECGQLCEADRQLRDGKLHEEYMTLMFDEFEAWQSVCRTLGLEPSSGISRERAAELFVFDVEFDSARDEFARYRRLELERAPVPQRLAALYALKRATPSRPDVFRRPIAALERVYDSDVAALLANMTPELARATDFDAILANLTGAERETPASERELDLAQRWRERAENDRSLAMLRDLLRRWGAASSSDEMLRGWREYQSFDFRGALSLASSSDRADLQRLLEASRVAERAAAARDAFRRKVAQLSRALDVSSDVDVISNLRAEVDVAADAAGLACPVELAQECDRRVDSILMQKRRRRVVATIGTLALLGVFTFMIVAVATRNRELKSARDAAAEINRRLDEFEMVDSNPKYYPSLAAAAELVERYAEEKPSFRDAPEFADAVARFTREQTSEETRKRSFEAAVEDVRAAHEAKRAAPERLVSVKKFARSEEERATQTELYRADVALASEAAKRRTEAQKTELDALAEDFKALEQDPNFDFNARGGELKRLRERVDSLAQSERSDFPAPLVNERKTLAAALEGFERRARRDAALDEMSAKLRDAIGDPVAYKNRLNELRAALAPDDECRATIASAISDLARVDDAAAWNKFADSYGEYRAWLRDASTFKKAVEALGDERKQNFAPEASSAREFANALRAFAEKGGFKKASELLREAVEPYERAAWVLRDTKSTRYYYLTSDPATSLVEKLKFLPAPDGVPEDFSEKEFTGDYRTGKRAPQCVVKRVVDDNLDDTPEGWFKAVDAALEQLDAMQEAELDPFVKVKLLVAIARSAENLPCFEPLVRWARTAEENVDLNVNFYRHDKELRAARAQAIAERDKIPDLKQLRADAKNAFDNILNKSLPRYEWIGFADVGNAPRITAKSNLLKDGATLWTAQAKSGVATRIGKIEGGAATIESDDDLTARRWTPTYQRVETRQGDDSK